jgi:hypothetical protein
LILFSFHGADLYVVTMCRFGIWLSVNIGYHNNIESPGSLTYFCVFFENSFLC